MKKICNKCGIEKEISEFHKHKHGKFGVRSKCKLCTNEYYKENTDRIKEYRKENSDKIKEYQKEYKKENSDKIKENKKEYRKENSDKIKEYQKEYQKEYRKEKYHSVPQFKLKCIIRSNVTQAFKAYTKNGKTKSCKEYGIDFGEIYNKVGAKPDGDFHLDHIIPISVFDLDDPKHVKLAHLPQNLRWLEGSENCSKNDKIDWELINSCEVLQMIAKEIGLYTKFLQS